MSSGEPSPWSGGYTGPWQPTASSVPDQSGLVGGNLPAVTDSVWPYGPASVTDDQLRRLPPPAWASTANAGDQRPGVVGLAVCLSVTAGMLWMSGLSLFWLVAVAGTESISPLGEDGYVFHTLDAFVLRMGDGLWVPLYGFPVLSVVSGFLLLSRRPWTRIVHTALGVAALGWAGWWLRSSLLSWVVVAVYVAMAVAVLWAPSVGRWYARRPAPSAVPG